MTAIYFDYEQFSDNTILTFIAIVILPGLLLVYSTFKNIIITKDLVVVKQFWKKDIIYKIMDVEKISIKKGVATSYIKAVGYMDTFYENIIIRFKGDAKLVISSGTYSNYLEMKKYFLELKS
ncbi:hypothetical protein [uncultured Cytophaga sp.]|uniref:hypothetical protein n=1 Tax=uncultured Cytophaga sp. TaxID=160238 RepID=UPI002603D5C5|nr:hypothetical protein [uncultured Cytophaga sp.]